jgi:putative ABC transport system permease protein
MFRLGLQTIRARKARFFLTAVAVILGVAFMAGTFVLTDTINKAYDGIAATKFASTDIVVQSQRSVENGTQGTERGTIPASVVEAVRRVDGVAAAEGIIDGTARLVSRDGKLVDGSREQATPIGMAWPATHGLNPLELVAGHAPSTPDEVVIDRASARDGRFAPGDTVRVVTASGSAQYTVAGVATYGSDDDAGGAGVVAFTPVTAANALGEPGRIDSVRALGAAGVTQSDLAARVSTALAASGQHADVEVITGHAAVADARDAAHQGISFMSTFLLVFAVVALVVGGFVIFNAFSITVAQRTKETAMVRAIGSSRKQVLRMVVAESVILGVVASAIGTVLGVGLARGLAALLESFGVELPGGSTVVASRSMVVSMVVSTVVTVLAAYLPARRASKVAPVAAMRDVAVDSSGRSRRRAVIGTVLTGLGGALLVAGAGGDGAAGPVGIGVLAVFAGVVVLGPVVGPHFVRVVGAPVTHLRGVTGVLARDNAARNPKRTAATASALMIGVTLVVLISVFAASARSSLDANIDTALRSDWVITPLQTQDGLSPTVAQAVDALPETASVTTFRSTPATLDGATVQVTGIDPTNVEQHLDLGVKAGAVSALGAHGLGVLQRTATKNHWHVGNDVTVTFPETGAQHFTIAVIYDLQNPLGEYTISEQAFAANVAHLNDQAVFVIDTPGVSQRAARTAIEGALAATPTARLHTPAEFKADIAGRIDKLLNLIYALLFLAVVIALFGIANTLTLSVVERRRELGLLRAVGMQRSQVRSSVRWEAVLIALLGTAVGTALGLGFGWALVKATSSQGIDQLAIPGLRLVVIGVVAALAAVAAAALPARRAARLDALQAITS